MNCIGCDAELDRSFAFCPNCGRGQETACAQCGAATKPGYAFCPACGAKQKPETSPPRAKTPPAEEADRRNVTVLFADVSGFTALAERLDPEDVRAFQNDLFETLSRSVLRFDGFVEKFVGDAAMAVFGAPHAHEDDPERALSAALDMMEQCKLLSARWSDRVGRPVGLHVGVHTGPVVAGNFGASAGAAYAVTGDTVNTTARLLAAAKGAILVSEATYELTRHRFSFEPVEEIEARGKSDPVRVRRLVGAMAEPASQRGLEAHGLATPMIGRADELDQLLGAFARMLRGRAQAVFVAGEAGIGKSRLIAEFLVRLRSEGLADGVAIRQVACSSLGEPTYGVFGAIFRDAYGVDRRDSLETANQRLVAGLRELGAADEIVDDVAPMLGYVLGLDDLRARDLEPEQLKRQISLAACTLIECRLAARPLLIVVEDLHWADTASVELLCEAADRLADRQLMLVVSHRPDSRPPLLGRVAQSVIRVAPLSGGETRSLVEGLFGAIDTTCAPQLVDFVSGRAGGNPYFVEEIARSLIGEGALVREEDRWVCTHGGDTSRVPPTLNGLLLSRVDKLPADVRRVLREASVIGVEFDEALLLAVSTNPTGVAGALQQLVDADLLARHGSLREPNRYRFRHALSCAAVYQNILMAQRVALHEHVARALESSIVGRSARLDELESLGHHWSLSAEKARGARHLAAAGDWARAVYANEDAIRHYARALEAFGAAAGVGEPEAATREKLADLLVIVGRAAEARAYYDRLLASSEEAGRCRAAARIDRKVGCLLWDAGDREGARTRFASGLSRLCGDDREERAQLFQQMGLLAFRTGDNANAIEWARKALAEGRLDDARGADAEFAKEIAEIHAHAHNTLGIALARLGRLDDAIVELKRSVELAEAHRLPRAICRGCANLGALLGSSDPKLGIETCKRGLDAAKQSGDLGFQSRLYANLAVSYCALADQCDDVGVEAARRAVELDRRLGNVDHLAVPLIILAQIHQCHGDRQLAFDAYTEARDLAEPTGEPQILFPCYDGLATLYLDSGDMGLAESYLEKAQAVCEKAGVEPDALTVLPFLT